MDIHYDDGVNAENDAIIQFAIQIIFLQFQIVVPILSYLDQEVQNFELYRSLEFNNSFKWLMIYVRVSVKIFEFLRVNGAEPAVNNGHQKKGVN